MERFLLPVPPIELPFELCLDGGDWRHSERVFDIEVSVPLGSSMLALPSNALGAGSDNFSVATRGAEETQVEEDLLELLEKLKDHNSRREELLRFTQNPVQYIQKCKFIFLYFFFFFPIFFVKIIYFFCSGD